MMTIEEQTICWAMVHVFKTRPHGCDLLWFDDRLHAVTLPIDEGDGYNEITITPETYELDNGKFVRAGYSKTLNLMVMSDTSKDVLFGSNIRG